jgi:hypothetical protein
MPSESESIRRCLLYARFDWVLHGPQRFPDVIRLVAFHRVHMDVKMVSSQYLSFHIMAEEDGY